MHVYADVKISRLRTSEHAGAPDYPVIRANYVSASLSSALTRYGVYARCSWMFKEVLIEDPPCCQASSSRMHCGTERISVRGPSIRSYEDSAVVPIPIRLRGITAPTRTYCLESGRGSYKSDEYSWVRLAMRIIPSSVVLLGRKRGD